MGARVEKYDVIPVEGIKESRWGGKVTVIRDGLFPRYNETGIHSEGLSIDQMRKRISGKPRRA